jgi:hypothetical protein
MASQSPKAFNARARAKNFKPEMLYRVYIAPGGLFFIRVGGQRATAYAGAFGLLGFVIAKMAEKGEKRRTEARIEDLDQRSLKDRLEDHKHNFRVPFDDFLSSSIDKASFWTSTGANAGRWTIRTEGQGKMVLEFDDVDEMDVAVEELPKVLGEKQRINVEWNDRKRKFVKAKRQ